MPDVLLQCPDELAGELKIAENDLPRTICVAAAVKFFETGRLSRESAAEFAGMAADEFLMVVTHLHSARKHTPAAGPGAGADREFDLEELRRLSGI